MNRDADTKTLFPIRGEGARREEHSIRYGKQYCFCSEQNNDFAPQNDRKQRLTPLRSAECLTRLKPKAAKENRCRAKACKRRLNHVQSCEGAQGQPPWTVELRQNKSSQNDTASKGEHGAVNIHQEISFYIIGPESGAEYPVLP
jgi:hypothetical protein